MTKVETKYALNTYDLRQFIQGYINEGLQIEDFLKSKIPIPDKPFNRENVKDIIRDCMNEMVGEECGEWTPIAYRGADQILALDKPKEIVIAGGELGLEDIGIDYVSGKYVTVGNKGYSLSALLENHIREENLIGKKVKLILQIEEEDND